MREGILALIAVKRAVDSQGFSFPDEEEKTNVFCTVWDASSKEFYQSRIAGITASLKVRVYTAEYIGQTIAEYDGRRYEITRSTIPNTNSGDFTILTLSDLSQENSETLFPFDLGEVFE